MLIFLIPVIIVLLVIWITLYFKTKDILNENGIQTYFPAKTYYMISQLFTLSNDIRDGETKKLYKRTGIALILVSYVLLPATALILFTFFID
jgi:hypothetical protein